MTVTTYRTSVSTVHSAYQRVADTYDTMEYDTPFQEYVYSGIEQENANNLAANVVLDNSGVEDGLIFLCDIAA